MPSGVKAIIWEDLDVGVASAMVLIKWSCAAARSVMFRQRGETLDTHADYGCQGSSNDVGGQIGYIWVPTDADGYVEWRVNIQDTFVLTLEAYISGPNIVDNSMYAGSGAGMAWANMDTDCGGGYHWVFVRNAQTGGAFGSNVNTRPGYTTPVWTGGLGEQGTLVGEFTYGFMQTDHNGIIDVKDSQGGAHTIAVSAIAYLSNLIKADQEVFRGAAPTAWQTLDLPVGRALVLLKISAPGATAGSNYRFRKGGEAVDVGGRGGPTSVWAFAADTDRFAYVWMVTNAYGQVEWICNNAVNIIVTLEAYIS